jgi:glutamate-1-semialdehyde 2,1-aminomutase
VTNFVTAKTSDTVRFGKYFQAMLKAGIYLAPSQFESMFISAAITPEIVDHVLDTHRRTVEGGFD